LVSFQNEPVAEVKEPIANQPTETKPAETKPVETKPAETKPAEVKPVETKLAETKPAEVKPVETKPAEAKPAETKPAETKPAEVKPIEVKPAEVKSGVDEVASSDTLYRPLSEVENDIRHHLTQIKIDKVLAEVEEKLRVHYDIYRKYIDKKIENPDLSIAVPPAPDFSSIIGEYDLAVVSEDLGTIFDIMRRSEFVRGELEREFITNWFKVRPYEYQAHKIGNEYSRILIWATDFVNEEIPANIDAVAGLRDKVVKRWKEVKARELAFKAAQDLAETTRTTKEPLNVTLASKPEVLSVTETEPFTWLTYGYSIDAGSPIRLGEVREKGVRYGEAEFGNKFIFAPGEEFMRVASGLEIGEVGTVFNQPQTTVHIIRLTSISPSEDSMWEDFKTAPANAYLQIGQQSKLFEAREAWLESIRAEMDFKWINKPTDEE
jgi:hypothetical protein